MELDEMVEAYLMGATESINAQIEEIQEAVRDEYSTGTSNERELAEHIHIYLDIEEMEVVVKIPKGVNSQGEKWLETLVAREFGKFGQSPNITILRYLL